MEKHQSIGFAAKHGADAVADPTVRAEIENRLDGTELSCALAFDIARNVKMPPTAVGKTADLMNLRLVKCQLGLFGYGSVKKIVEARTADDEQLVDVIRESAADNRLPCHRAWEIAARFKVPKLTVGGVCEGLGIRIKPCQLGAF